jgi:multidrug transporter EmrE-like cation transporter
MLCLVMGRGKLPGAREWIYGAAIGVPNFYASQFMLQALATVPGVIAYPVYSVAGILLVTLAGVAFFRERLEKRQWIAMGIILLSLVLLNL